MIRLNAIVIMASIAAVLFSAPMAHARGRGIGVSGGGVPPGTTVPVYGSAWAAEQRKSHDPNTSDSDSGHPKTGQIEVTAIKGG